MKKITNLSAVLFICLLLFSCDVKRNLEDIQPLASTEITRVIKFEEFEDGVYSGYSREFFYDSIGNLQKIVQYSEGELYDELLFSKIDDGKTTMKRRLLAGNVDASSTTLSAYYKNYINGKPSQVEGLHNGYQKNELIWNNDKLIRVNNYLSALADGQYELRNVYDFTYDEKGNVAEYKSEMIGLGNDTISTVIFNYDDKYTYYNFLPEEELYDIANMYYPGEVLYSKNNIIGGEVIRTLKSTGEIVDNETYSHTWDYTVDDQNRVIASRIATPNGTIVERRITYKTFIIN